MTRSMNSPVRALMLLPRYILMLLVFAFVAELSFMLYYDTTQLVCGRHIMLFNGGALLAGLAVVIPTAMLSAGAMLGVHRVRHSGGGILSILAYIVLGALTWFMLFPALLGVIDKIETNDVPADAVSLPAEDAPVLTQGYFREYGRDRVYLPHDFEAESMAAVLVSGYEDAADALEIKRISRKQMTEDAKPFSDILVKDTVPSVAKWITDGFSHFTKRAQAAKKGGFISWASFASIGVVLFATYALSFCSQWRLMSVVIMLSMYAGCLSFNALYFSPLFRFMRVWSLSVPVGTGNETLLVCINLCLAVLFVLLGALSALVRNRREA